MHSLVLLSTVDRNQNSDSLEYQFYLVGRSGMSLAKVMLSVSIYCKFLVFESLMSLFVPPE